MLLVKSALWKDTPPTEAIMRDTFYDDFEIAMKVVIVGNGSVGKSSMIQRFCRGIFTRDYKKTIGVDFLERVMTIDGQSVRLMLWDTAGQEEFDAITRTYYRGANACVLACSVTDKDSFLALPKWKNKIAREVGDIPMVLVANKIDLHKQAVVDSAELEAMARSLGITKLFRTSVKDDVNVNCVFTFLSQVYVTSALAPTPSPSPPPPQEENNVRDGINDEIALVSTQNSRNFFGFKTSQNNKNKLNAKNPPVLSLPPPPKGFILPPPHPPSSKSFSNGLHTKPSFHPAHGYYRNNNNNAAHYRTTQYYVDPTRWNDPSQNNVPFRLNLVNNKNMMKRRKQGGGCSIL